MDSLELPNFEKEEGFDPLAAEVKDARGIDQAIAGVGLLLEVVGKVDSCLLSDLFREVKGPELVCVCFRRAGRDELLDDLSDVIEGAAEGDFGTKGGGLRDHVVGELKLPSRRSQGAEEGEEKNNEFYRGEMDSRMWESRGFQE
jgi:hypothetical protein